jgi:transposase
VKFYTCPTCPHCGQRSVVELTDEEYEKVIDPNRGLIQNVLPNRDVDFREVIITGTHPECWDKMFEGMDDA